MAAMMLRERARSLLSFRDDSVRVTLLEGAWAEQAREVHVDQHNGPSPLPLRFPPRFSASSSGSRVSVGFAVRQIHGKMYVAPAWRRFEVRRARAHAQRARHVARERQVARPRHVRQVAPPPHLQRGWGGDRRSRMTSNDMHPYNRCALPDLMCSRPAAI